MIKIDMTADALDKQIELLKFYPEILVKHFRPVLVQDVKELETRIRPTIPVLSGRARNAFKSKVTGKGINLTGQVGFFGGKNAPWYINIVEYGARAHSLEMGQTVRTRKGASIFESRKKRGLITGQPIKVNGRWVTIKTHPGFSARGFMAAGFSAMQAKINADLAAANEGVVKDLAL